MQELSWPMWENCWNMRSRTDGRPGNVRANISVIRSRAFHWQSNAVYPPEVCHIIAAHAGEGDHVKRTAEAIIVHHADFMTFLSFRDRLVV